MEKDDALLMVTVKEDLKYDVIIVAAQQRISRSELMRRAIEEYLTRHATTEHAPRQQRRTDER